MCENSAQKLRLAAPLYYAPAANIAPFAWGSEGGLLQDEQLFCFALDGVQCRSIEPDAQRLLGKLLFAGQCECTPDRGEGAVRLPAGSYLFVQRREPLDRNACLALAVEQQKDGLWERIMPADKLYIRYLFEDGSAVTQLFRPYSEGISYSYSRTASTM